MRRLLWVLVVVPSLLATGAGACVYPAPLRDITTTMAAILDAGGDVNMHNRTRLRRAVAQVSPDALQASLRGDIARRDHKAVVAILDKAVALANGNGLRVPETLRDHTTRLKTATQTACSGAAHAVGGGDDAAGAEHGASRQTGNGGRALTFREGVARLSITFTIYLVFLAGLLGFRRTWIERYPPPPDVTDEAPAPMGDRSQMQ